MSKTTAFGSVTEAKLNDIYKKEPHIYKVQTSWYAGDIYVQYDYDYVLTTLTRDQLAYYLVHDYNLPVWSADHGYSDDLTAGFRIEPFKGDIVLPFNDTENIYAELLNTETSQSYTINHLVLIEPDKKQLAKAESDPTVMYETNKFIFQTKKWKKALQYLSDLRDKDIQKVYEQAEQERADQQMNDIVDTISKMSVDKKQEILKHLLK